MSPTDPNGWFPFTFIKSIVDDLTRFKKNTAKGTVTPTFDQMVF